MVNVAVDKIVLSSNNICTYWSIWNMYLYFALYIYERVYQPRLLLFSSILSCIYILFFNIFELPQFYSPLRLPFAFCCHERAVCACIGNRTLVYTWKTFHDFPHGAENVSATNEQRRSIKSGAPKEKGKPSKIGYRNTKIPGVIIRLSTQMKSNAQNHKSKQLSKKIEVLGQKGHEQGGVWEMHFPSNNKQ